MKPQQPFFIFKTGPQGGKEVVGICEIRVGILFKNIFYLDRFSLSLPPTLKHTMCHTNKYTLFFSLPLTQLADRFSPSLFRVCGGQRNSPPTTSPYQKTKKKKKRKKGEALWMNAKAKENQRNEWRKGKYPPPSLYMKKRNRRGDQRATTCPFVLSTHYEISCTT